MKPRKKRASAPQPKATPPAVRPPNAALQVAALGVLLLLAYSNSFTAGFILDNKGLLLQDSRVHRFTADNIRLILQHTYWWPTGEAGLYRPVTTLSFLFNYAVLGNADHPAGYHWINFLLHAGNVLLVYFLMRRLLRGAGRQNVWLPFFIAAVWAVHPVLTESVTNMIGRSDLLAAMALLSGFLMYLKSTETTGRERIAWLAGLTIVTAIGVFSKESAVAIPGVIVVYELGFRKQRKQGRALLTGCVATLLPILAML